MKYDTLVFPVIAINDVFQLKRDYKKNYSVGMAAAVLIHILITGAYFFLNTTAKSEEIKTRTVQIDWTYPQPINTPVYTRITVSSPGTILKNAIPIPVPDEKGTNNKLIPSQNELSNSLIRPGEYTGSEVKAIPPGNNIESSKAEVPDIKEFTPYEKAPELLESVTPVYPELARRSGIEGTVYVKVLIGKDGKPLNAVAVKYDSEIFIKPSLEAAMKCIFTPAIQHKAPVMVWMMVPFKFRLNN
jgi:protein TonB